MSALRHRALVALVLLALVPLAGCVFSVSGREADLNKRLDKLEKRIDDLEKRP